MSGERSNQLSESSSQKRLFYEMTNDGTFEYSSSRKREREIAEES